MSYLTLFFCSLCVVVYIHCVSKKRANCNFDKHETVLIIGEQHQHTFKNDMHVQLSSSLLLLLIYLLLSSCDGNDAKKRVFLGRLLAALKRAGFSLADVQSDVSFPSCLHVTGFSIDQLLRRFVICLPMCHWCAAPSRWCRGQVSCTQYTHIPAPVAKFCSRPAFWVNRTVWRTQIWRDKIECLLLNELA